MERVGMSALGMSDGWFSDADLARWGAVPYRSGGRDLTGWDCWGCVAWIGRERFGADHGQLAGAYADAVTETDVVAQLVRARLPAYQAQPSAAPGLVGLMSVAGERVHVGLAISPRLLIHALDGAGTLFSAPGDRWWRRVVGWFQLAEFARG